MAEGRRRTDWVLVLVCVAVFVVILDATIVAVALADIRSELGLGESQVAWVVNAYTLAFAGFLLLGGRCADVFGHRRTLLVGAVVFTAASVAAGLAGSAGVLLAARAVQGVGGALLMPTTLAVLTTTRPPGPERARALAVWSMVGACGATAGTLLGGVLTAWAGWRWVFLVNLPIGVLMVVLVAVHLRGGPRRDGARPRLDLVGAVLATAGLGAVVYAVMTAAPRGPGDPLVLGCGGAGLVVLGLFGAHQQWISPEPLMPPSILRVRTVAGANAVMFLIGLAFFASPVLLSLYLQTVQGLGPFGAGVAFVPGAIGLVVGGRVAGRSTVALGARRAAVAGLTAAAVGFAAIAVLLLDPTPSMPLLEIAVAVFGLGVGASFTPLTVVATTGVPADRAGMAGGVLNTVRQASGALGLAVLTVVAAASAPDGPGPGGPGSVTPGAGYANAYALAASFAAAAAVLAAVVLPRDHRGVGSRRPGLRAPSAPSTTTGPTAVRRRRGPR